MDYEEIYGEKPTVENIRKQINELEKDKEFMEEDPASYKRAIRHLRNELAEAEKLEQINSLTRSWTAFDYSIFHKDALCILDVTAPINFNCVASIVSYDHDANDINDPCAYEPYDGCVYLHNIINVFPDGSTKEYTFTATVNAYAHIRANILERGFTRSDATDEASITTVYRT